MATTIDATVTAVITHADGTLTSVTRSVKRRTGDNPRFLVSETEAAIKEADRFVLDGVRAIHAHRPLDDPGPGDKPWHCQVCGGPCQATDEERPCP